MATTTITGNFADLLSTMHGALIATGKFSNVPEVDENTFACKKNDESLYISFTFNTYSTSWYSSNTYYASIVYLTVTASSEWDLIGKAPIGSIQVLTIPMFSQYGSGTNNRTLFDAIQGTTGLLTELLANPYEMTFFCDEYGLYANIKNPYNYDTIECTGDLIILEFIPSVAREYNDGNPSVMGIVIPSTEVHATILSKWGGQKLHLRSFVYNGIASLYRSYRPAFKSAGNNKVYFEFPYYYNDPDAGYKSPIARTNRWFEVQKSDSGLISGDIISWLDVDGVSVRKYLITEIASGDGSHEKFFAIPYDNAKSYTAP